MSGNDERQLKDYPVCKACKDPASYWEVRNFADNDIAYFNSDAFLKLRGRKDKVNLLTAANWTDINAFYMQVRKLVCVKCKTTIYYTEQEFSKYWHIAEAYLIKKFKLDDKNEW